MNLNEERATNIEQIINDLKKLDSIEEIINVRGMQDGFTVFARGTDGNAYEIEIRPAPFARGHDEVRGAGQYTQRKKKRLARLRQDMGLG